MGRRLAELIGPLFGLALLVIATVVLRRELSAFHLHDVVGHIRAVPLGSLAMAVGLTILGYFVLTGYDALAFRFIGNSLSYPRIALTSFTAYVFSHNVGLSFFGGSAVRYRMFSSWGVRGDEIARVIVFTMLTFWMGFLLLGAICLSAWPLSIDLPGLPVGSSRPIGAIFAVVLVAYLATTLLRRRPIAIQGFQVDLPRPIVTAQQVVLSTVVWMLAAAVLYAVLPPAAGLSFAVFIGAYLLAQIIGLVSHVPGGLGVFESAMVLLLRPYLPGDQVLAAIVIYRIVYYLFPMIVAVALFAAYEIRDRRARLAGSGIWIQRWMSELVPRLFAVTTFLAGTLMLLSGAAPETPERVAWLREILPVPVLELSKLAGSVLGVGLLVLANSLRQRIDAAYVATLAMLVAGTAASLLKGFNWEEALVLTVMALMLLPCRGYFYRRSSLLAEPLSTGWWVAVAVVAIGSFMLLDLAYRHVEYSHELWWKFGAGVQAPRSMRALLAGGVFLSLFGAVRLLRPAPPSPGLPSESDLDRALTIAARSSRATAYLALLRDKQILFHESGNAFLMYGISGRTWVSMGDPVGSANEQQELAWQFVELAHRHGGRAAFYEVTEETLPIYVELGLELNKLGEEARVPMTGFSLEGKKRADLRQARNRLTRDGCSFEILPPEAVAGVLDEAAEVSDIWLAAKNTREKRFSLGCFDRDYLRRLPMAVARKDGRLIAFANVWPSAAKEELTIDLMRYRSDAPKGVMEFLFAELMLWAQSQGYRYFSLGMAPLAGVEHHALAPLWNRLGALLFRHGEHFYNFRGLHAFKEKFDPEWAPRYLASPGGWSLPIVLTSIASLVSGGVKGVVAK